MRSLRHPARIVPTAAVLLLTLLTTTAWAGPPPVARQLQGGVQLDSTLARVLGGELEAGVTVAALGLGVGVGLVAETDDETTVALRLLLQLRPIDWFGFWEWSTVPLKRWIDPLVQISGALGGGTAFRAFVAVDAGIDVGLWHTPWHPVIGVRIRHLLGQTDHAQTPMVMFTLGGRHLDPISD